MSLPGYNVSGSNLNKVECKWMFANKLYRQNK